MVQKDAHGYKAVDYSRMIPVLVQAMKEQQEEVNELKKLNEQQQDDIEQLKKQLAELLKTK